jgi:hypothetical protein
MRRTAGPLRIAVVEIDPGRHMPVYRIVRSDLLSDPVLLNSLRSNYELSHAPRNIERSSTVIHMGISAYTRANTAEQTANKWSKLGGFIAEIDLVPGFGFNFAHTGFPGHLTIWGDPVKLHDAITAISPV